MASATQLSGSTLASPRRARAGRSAVRTVASAVPSKASQAASAGMAAAISLASAAPAFAAEAVSSVADASAVSMTVGATGAIAGLAFLLVTTDPDKRRKQMAEAVGGDEMESVRKYFNTAGFERWNKIYGETEDVNKVQLDIRVGHAQTVDKVINWLKMDGGIEGKTVCDAGCGTGSLAIPLALSGAHVSASDISEAMAGEAKRRYEAEVAKGSKAPSKAPVFYTSDLEGVTGKYDVVTCLDVMIHYPQDKADAMVQHLASLAEKRLIVSFAPYTLSLALLKRELFPGAAKATRAYLHKEEDVEAALAKVGWKVKRREMTSTSFYFSKLLEFERA